MTRQSLLQYTLVALLALLSYGILTIWVLQSWAWIAFQIGAYLCALGWAIAIGWTKLPVLITPSALPLAAAVVWPLVQLAAGHTIYRWMTWNSFWVWAAYLAVFFLAVQVASDSQYLRRFVLAVLYFSVVLSAVSCVQMFTSEGRIFWLFPSGYTDFVLGPFVYRNQYAAFIELTLPIALYFAVVGKNRLGFSLMAAVMIGSVIAAASRAGSFLVLAEVLAVPLLARRELVISSQAAGAVLLRNAGFTVAAALVVGAGAAWQRFLAPDPYFLRREVLISSLAMIRDHPWMGSGLGTWVVAYPQYAIFDPGAVMNQAHNDWAQWAVEGGLPFLALMLSFSLLLVRPALRSIWGVGVLFVLLHALVDYPLQQRPALAALYFAMAGAVAGTTRTSPLGRTTVRPRIVERVNV